MKDQKKQKKERFGDFEGDTIVGKNHQQGIVTNVERKSGLLLAKKVRKKTAEEIADVTAEMFFAWHKVIEVENKITVYFADPYSPWQRGSLENVNGLLRQFIPKGTDFDTVSAEDLQKYLDLINNRPRKRLGFKTPLEVFTEEKIKVAVRGGM